MGRPSRRRTSSTRSSGYSSSAARSRRSRRSSRARSSIRRPRGPTPAAKSPFKRSNSMPGLGPYTIDIKNPTREFVLTKTPGFDIPGLAKGNIDTITVVKGTVTKMTQDVIDNKLDYMTEDPTGGLLPEVKAKYANRF